MKRNAVRSVRVFLCSPGDVTAERDRAKRFFEKLSAEMRDTVRFELVRWEDGYYTAAADFQSQIPRPSECDLVLCVLWKRLGTQLPRDRYQREDGSPYGSGTEYEFEDAYLAARERRVPDIFMYRKTERATFDADTATREQAQWQALRAFWEKWFTSAEGHFTAAFDTFGSTDEFEERLERHLRKWLERKLPQEVVWRPEKGSPFRGLRAFHEEHAPIFFGRDRAVRQAKAQLVASGARGTPYLLILGMSGSGKSSLVQAGLIPRLTEPGAVAGVDIWRSVIFRPSELGDDPAGVLARKLLTSDALPELAQGDFANPETLARQLADPTLAAIPIRGALNRIATKAQQDGAFERPFNAQLLLYVDQLEELFALPIEARERFATLLDALVRARVTWAVASLRSDSYPSYQADPVLLALKGDGAHLDLRPPGEAEIPEIIRRPAQAAGFSFESNGERELDQLLENSARAPGSLPLLEFTLDELYKGRDTDRKLLTLAAYDTLGGLEGAIEKRAENVFAGLPQRARSTLPRVLRALVRFDNDGTVRRHYANLSELTADAATTILVEAFIDARLFTTDGIEQPVVSVAHEALFTHWPRARRHIESDRSDIAMRDQLQAEAVRWREEHHKSGTRLIERGARLNEASGLVKRRRDELPLALVEFVDRSLTAACRQRTRAIVVAAIAVPFIVWAASAVMQQVAAERDLAVITLARSDFLEGNRLVEASRLVESGDTARGLAYLARAIRSGSDAAAARTWDLLARRSWPRLAAQPMTHDSQVRYAAFSPDGSSIVTTSDDNTSREWDATTGAQLTEPLRHDGRVIAAGFNSDGSRVLTASDDNTVHVWDATTGAPLSEPLEHNDRITAAAFSTDGSQLVTASDDGTVRVWDATTGAPLSEPLEHNDRITAAAFSTDGSQLVTASDDGTVRVWDATTGAPLSEPLRHDSGVTAAAFSPNGTRIVTASWDRTARVWDAASGALLIEHLRHDGVITAAAYDPAGTRIVTGSIDRTVRVWDATTGAQLGEPFRHDDIVTAAAFSSNGTRIFTASRDGTARVWHAPTVAPLTELLRHESRVVAAEFSTDGSRIFTITESRTARIWDAANGTLLGEPFRSGGDVVVIAFSPDGTRIVTGSLVGAGSIFGTAQVWDAETGEPLTWRLRHNRGVVSAAFSPDSSRIVTASEDRAVRVWDAETGEPLTEPLRPNLGVTATAFSPDGSQIVIVSADGAARVWDVATQSPLSEPMWHEGGVTTAAFSPDGTRFVTSSSVGVGSMFGTALVREAATGAPLTEPLRHEGAVIATAFNPDGTRILTGSNDGTARVWDAATGAPLTEPLRHEGAVIATAFNPDGTRILTGSSDATARVWDAPAIAPPPWAADLAEAMGGYRLTSQGVIEPLMDQYERQYALELEADSHGDDPWHLLRAWLFAPPNDRTISPLSHVTVPEYIHRRLDEEGVNACYELQRHFPTQPLVRSQCR